MTCIEWVWAEKSHLGRTGTWMAWTEWMENIQFGLAGAEGVLSEWVWVERTQTGSGFAGSA